MKTCHLLSLSMNDYLIERNPFSIIPVEGIEENIIGVKKWKF
jgi:hypothetical protein